MSATKVKKMRKPRAKKVVTIPLIRIINPFDPRQRVQEELVWASAKTLREYFPLQATPVVISINGKIVPESAFESTYLDKTDNVVMCPVPTGGGDSKQILGMIAMIAIAIAAPAIAGALNSSLGMGLSGFGLSALQAGVMMAGSLLVNAIFAPPKPTQTNQNVSPSYGIDGAKNTSVEGIPVPVCYGEFRTAGNILGMYVENDGDTQMLYMLISAGEGVIAGIRDIEINDNPITDYKNVEIAIRSGTQNQAVIPWFSDTIVSQNKSQKMTQDWFYHTTTTPVDKFRLNFTAPQGLCSINKSNGATQAYGVDLEMQYRPSTGGEWKNVVDITEVVDDFSKEGLINDAIDMMIHGGTPYHHSSKTAMSAAQRSAVRKTFASDKLDNLKYEIRARRVTPKSTETNIIDEIYLTDIDEVQLQMLGYPNTALLGIKIKLTDQLSSIPSVTYINSGRIINVYADGKWIQEASKNPAWIVWDILTNRRFGGGMPTNRLDFQAFKEWADYCDQKNLTWNGVLDTEMNVWDATQYVLRVGHAQLVNIGTRFTVVCERPASPVMMFSVANMMEGTYKETWLGTNDRANEIDVTFFDKTDKHKQRTVKVYDPAAIAAGNKQRTSAITLYGVDDYQTALREGLLQLNMNRFILKTVSFSAPLEAIACTVGDVVLVQHDMTDWAQAGRFAAGSTTSVVNLDRPVKMVEGKQYKLLILHDAVKRYEGAVQNVAGDSVFLTGFDGNKPVKRIKIDGADYRIAGIFNQGGSAFGVIIDDASAVNVGSKYTLWDTDVIEEYGVVNNNTESDTLTLQTPAIEAPGQFVNWMFGDTEKVKNPFRIKSITGSHEYRRDITAVQYDEKVYDYERFGDLNGVAITPGVTAIGNVRNLTAYEETYISGETIKTNVVATWQSPEFGYYGGADVHVKVNDGKFEKVGKAVNSVSYSIPANKDDTVTVKVVAYDFFGKTAQYSSAPEAVCVVVGEVPSIEVGDVTGADCLWAGRECKIEWRYNSVTHSYEFGSEPTGADAGALDPQFKDYEIKVFDGEHKKLRRTEYVTANTYSYSYDKNFADGVTRRLTFEIRMRDKFNNLGKPAILSAYNPPPNVAGAAVETSFESATIAYTHSNDPDFAGALIYVSSTSSDLEDLSKASPVYDGPDSSVVIGKLMFDKDYFYRIAPYDAFGQTELKASVIGKFRTKFFNVDSIADGVLKDSKLVPELKTRIDLIDAPETTVGSVAARILAEAKARGTDISEVRSVIKTGNDQLAQTITTLSAVVNNNVAAIRNESMTRADKDSALATQLDALAAAVNNNTAAILSEATVRSDADKAEALQRSQQLASYDEAIKSYVQNYSYSKATSDYTINQVYSTLRSEYNSAANSAYSSALSYIQNYSYSKAEANSAIAGQVNQITARLDNVGGVTMEQKFNVQASVNSGLYAQYTLKIDNNGYISGFGFASTAVNGTPVSEFIINADSFAVVTPGGSEHPFTVGKVNGITRTIIKDALIGDATITSSKIGDLQVNSAKIANLTVGENKITGNAVTEVDQFASVDGLNGTAFYVSVPCSVLVIASTTYDQNGRGGVAIATSQGRGTDILVKSDNGPSETTQNVILSAYLNPGLYYIKGTYSNPNVGFAYILKVKK